MAPLFHGAQAEKLRVGPAPSLAQTREHWDTFLLWFAAAPAKVGPICAVSVLGRPLVPLVEGDCAIAIVWTRLDVQTVSSVRLWWPTFAPESGPG